MHIAPIIPVLYEDDEIAVVCKPAGLLVHPVAADSAALTLLLPSSWHLLHRLDRDTSGAVALAKNPLAARRMGKAFMRGQVEKSYLAVVQPAPVMGQGEVHLPLLKIQARMCPHPEGQVAHTTWRVLRRWGDKALVQLIPLTGRMHQLRAHMAAIGCPIMGDVFYQGAPAPRLMLHAYKLKLPLKPAIIAGLSWVKTQ